MTDNETKPTPTPKFEPGTMSSVFEVRCGITALSDGDGYCSGQSRFRGHRTAAEEHFKKIGWKIRMGKNKRVWVCASCEQEKTTNGAYSGELG